MPVQVQDEAGFAPAATSSGTSLARRVGEIRVGAHDQIAGTAANIAWLKKQEYRYLVVSRNFDPDHAVDTLTA
jgi:hypothetical protein